MISEGCFEYCSALVSVTIPASVTSIETTAFKECSLLVNVYYQGTENQWKENISKGFWWDYKTGTYTIVYECNSNNE